MLFLFEERIPDHGFDPGPFLGVIDFGPRCRNGVAHPDNVT